MNSLSMQDWEARLGGVLDGATAARVGDLLDSLPVEAATRLWPRIASLRRKPWRHDPSLEVSKEGKWVPVPRDQLLAELRRYGGYMAFADRTFEIADGRIRSLQLRPDALMNPPRSEAELSMRFGPPSEISGSGDTRLYRYDQAKLSVGWSRREDRLTNANVGPAGEAPQLLTSVAVLSEWLAVAAQAIDGGGPPSGGPRSAVLRQKRLAALLRAFALGSPAEFAEGAFLKRPLGEYPLALAVLSRGLSFGVWAGNPVGLERELRHLFSGLLAYRTRCHRSWCCASHYIEAGTPSASMILRMTSDANLQLLGALWEIDGVLLELISPTDRLIPEPELVDRWGYATDDELRNAVADEW